MDVDVVGCLVAIFQGTRSLLMADCDDRVRFGSVTVTPLYRVYFQIIYTVMYKQALRSMILF